LNIANSNFTLKKIFYSLISVITIRTYLEFMLEKNHSLFFYKNLYLNLVSYAHIYLSWLCVYFTIAVILSFFLGIKIIESIRLTVIFSPVTIIPPLFDYFYYDFQGGNIFYSFEINTFLYNYLNCFNPYVELDMVSRGVRLEILLVILGAFYLSLLVFEKKLFLSIVLTLVIYSTIFLYGYLPAIFKTFGLNFYKLSGFSLTGITLAQKFFYMYLFVFIVLIFLILYALKRENYENLSSILSFLYPSRLIFYLLLLGMGFLFISKENNIHLLIFNFEDLLKFLSASISIIMLFLYAKILNDIYDIDIDKLSNASRPIVSNRVLLETAESLKQIFLLLSLVFAIATDQSFIFYWFFIASASYVYSAPPLRIRKFYPFGHLLLATIGVSVFLAGGSLIKSYYDIYNIINKNIIIYIFIAYFSISNIKDFKDIDGDIFNNVMNICGYIKFPKILSIIFITTYTICLFFIGQILEINSILLLILLSIFLIISTFHIYRTKNIKNIEKLIYVSLLVTIFIFIAWIFNIYSLNIN